MHQRTRPVVAPRSLRPSLDMVERRRRELIDGGDERAHPLLPLLRVGAALVLFGAFGSTTIGLGIIVDAGIRASATPAYAALDATRMKHATMHVRRIPMKPSSSSVAHRAAAAGVGRDRRIMPARASRHGANAGRQSGDPAAAPAPEPSASTTQGPALVATPWRLTADGEWSAIVSLTPPGDDPAKSSATFTSDRGDVLPLDGHAEGAPGVIITVDAGGSPVDVDADTAPPDGPSVSLALPPPPSDPASFAAVAQPVGPYLIDVGWMPLAGTGVTQFKIYRKKAGAARGTLVADVSPGGASWHDGSAQPSTTYEYTVVAQTSDGARSAMTGAVTTPAVLPSTDIGAISGKGMFLYFVPDPSDPNGFPIYDPDAVVAKAKTAGITHIELRMARGTFIEAATPDARAWLDRFIDKAVSAGITLIAWQVPRRASTDDAAAAVSIAEYRTPEGYGFSALALDIEDGDNYMGEGEAAKQRMVDQIEMVRQAVGPEYLVVATVMSPKLTHWTNQRYPYDRIAPYATVMQPMEYWHHYYSSTGHEYSQDEVTSACADSVSMTQALAGRDVPVDVAGQSDDLGTTGAPSGDEIGWCLTGSKSAGAVGQTFFDWRGTGDDAWSAIAGFDW